MANIQVGLAELGQFEALLHDGCFHAFDALLEGEVGYLEAVFGSHEHFAKGGEGEGGVGGEGLEGGHCVWCGWIWGGVVDEFKVVCLN